MTLEDHKRSHEVIWPYHVIASRDEKNDTTIENFGPKSMGSKYSVKMLKFIPWEFPKTHYPTEFTLWYELLWLTNYDSSAR